MTKINVITPTYNDAHLYLVDTICSVLNQYKSSDFEIVHTIIDDGTLDHRASRVLDRLASCNSISIISQVNKGLPSARNLGINSVDSDYVLPLDPGDLIHPLYIYSLFSCAHSIPTYDQNNSIVTSNWSIFGRHNRQIFVRTPSPSTIRYSNFLPSCSLIPSRLASDNLYDELMTDGFDDWELWIRLIAKQKSKIYVSRLFGYYQRDYISYMTLSTLRSTHSCKKYIRDKHPSLYRGGFSRQLKNFNPFGLYNEIEFRFLSSINDLANKFQGK